MMSTIDTNREALMVWRTVLSMLVVLSMGLVSVCEAQPTDTRPVATDNIFSMYGTIICSSADDPVHGYYE
ncbi:MAG: hypothetical protein FWE95_11500, partial [Planctomycetaceae bacterium]|nr:hypothetical protein [Planctomycetaceae bacterium]